MFGMNHGQEGCQLIRSFPFRKKAPDNICCLQSWEREDSVFVHRTRVKTSIQGWNGGKGVAEQPLKKTICKFWLEASRENYQLNITDQLHIILKLQVQQS